MVRPDLSSSMSTTARMVTEPRPVRYASSMPWRPTISAPLGKSGPLTRSIAASSSSSARRLGVLQRPLHGGGDLAQVVGRDVGGHADRDAGGAVDQQVGEPGRQDDRLLLLAVVVRLEVDGVLGDVADHLHGQRRHLALGVAHRRGRVVARRAEVALARRPADRASPRAAPAGPGCRRSPSRRAGGTAPSPHRRRGRTCSSRGRAGSRRRTSRRGSAGAPASARRVRRAAPARRSRSSRSRGRTSGSRPAGRPAPAGRSTARVASQS